MEKIDKQGTGGAVFMIGLLLIVTVAATTIVLWMLR